MQRCFFILIGFFLLTGAAFAQQAPANFGSWRPDKGDLYEALRANAPFYWKWLRMRVSANPLFSAEGVVVGDAHILNFGDIALAVGGRAYGLIDPDDGGQGPLIADYLHFLVGNQLSAYQASTTDLWNAYLAGLSGQESGKSDLVREVETKTDADFAAKQAKYIAKMTRGNHFSASAAVDPMGQAPPEIARLFAAALPEFRKEWKGFLVLDQGYEIKKGGGSQGLVRFRFLLAKGSERHIWEFKQEVAPAVSLYEPQLEAEARFQNLCDIYRPSFAPLGPYKFIRAGGEVFLLRERLKSFLDLDPTINRDSASVKDGRELAVYLANQLGLWQSRQPGGAKLLALIQANPTDARQDLENLAQSYIQEMETQQAAAP